MFKQNIGIALLSWFIIIFAIINSITATIGIYLYLTNSSEGISLFLVMLRAVFAIAFFILGIEIIKLRLWARMITIATASIFLIFDCIKIILKASLQQLSDKFIFIIISMCINLIIIYFLNKPSVKEQFK
ncbi:MAG: hypothetical protein JSV30_04510 [Candidatus Omnitrophota bacterium]|nr:MAG: hypothetical protein JSV30_04510 [Candidatus Omnitrophota bacterium]